jgi:hypothetical protein
MAVHVCDGVLSIEGENGQRIGIRTGGPTIIMHVGKGAASLAESNIGIGTKNAPHCRLEVRCDGKVGVGRK